MKKDLCFIFFFGLLALSNQVNAKILNYNFDGVSLKCVEKNFSILSCKDGQKDILVAITNSRYVIFDQFDPPRAKYVKKILENNILIHQDNGETKIVESLEMQRRLAEVISSGTLDLKDSFSTQVNQQAQNFLKKSPEYINNVNVVLENRETLNCTKGDTQASKNIKLVCSYYSCTGNDSKENILLYMPPIGSGLIGPSVIAMKNGQARYYDNNFTIQDSSKSIISVVNKSSYAQHEYNPINDNVTSNAFVPAKYNQSRTSLNYLNQYAYGDQDAFGLKSVCKDLKITKLFNEQKKIASEINQYLTYTDIVSYLTLVNEDIHSVYIDRKKAQSLGCSYQDMILDNSVLPELKRLENMSGAKLPKKYLTEQDVQKLFKQAQQMQDIPFEYKDDGCYARAHIIARRFEAAGVPVKKAWIQGDLNVPGTGIKWKFHVAPLIEAKDSSGKIVQYVIDPTLTDNAVTLDQWAATMNKGPGKIIMKTGFPMPENGLDFNRTVIAVSSSDAYYAVDNKFLTEADKMTDARSILSEYTSVLDSLNMEKAR